MTRPCRRRRTYDHRIRDAIATTGNPHLYGDIPIPMSTRRSWIRAQFQPAVTCTDTELEVYQLLDRVDQLQTRVRRQSAIIAILMRLVCLRGGKLRGDRVPSGRDKRTLLRAIASAARVLGLSAALRIAGITASRYHAWCRKEKTCGLADESSCPRSFPTRLTPAEVSTMRGFVESPDYRHIAIMNLAIHTQRIGKLFACAGTWYKLMRQRGWRRPRRRVHPENPRVGIRADRPNQYWHTDATVIRLTNGARIYLQAIIDNFSRKILSWRVSDALTSQTTRELLIEAVHGLHRCSSSDVNLVIDGGSENYGAVDELLEEPTRLNRLLAQTDIIFSNSLIEAWWRELKHRYLFMHVLDSTHIVRKLVKFYVEQHNAVVGRAMFDGRTPDEVYRDEDAALPQRLAEQRAAARRDRIAWNRSRRCVACSEGEELVGIQPHRVNNGIAA